MSWVAIRPFPKTDDRRANERILILDVRVRVFELGEYIEDTNIVVGRERLEIDPGSSRYGVLLIGMVLNEESRLYFADEPNGQATAVHRVQVVTFIVSAAGFRTPNDVGWHLRYSVCAGGRVRMHGHGVQACNIGFSEVTPNFFVYFRRFLMSRSASSNEERCE